MRPKAIRFVRFEYEHAQSEGKSVNRRLPVLELARGRDSGTDQQGAGCLWGREWFPSDSLKFLLMRSCVITSALLYRLFLLLT